MMSDFRPEIERWPFYACAMKIMQYHYYLWQNCQNCCVFQEIGVEEHDGDIKFQTGSRNMAVTGIQLMVICFLQSGILLSAP